MVLFSLLLVSVTGGRNKEIALRAIVLCVMGCNSKGNDNSSTSTIVGT